MTQRNWLALGIFLVGSLALHAQNPAQFRTVPWTVFAGAGTDFDSYSLSLGARRGPFGLGFGYRHSTKDVLPIYSTNPAPAGATDERSFAMSSVGVDLYTATQMADFLTLYGVVGGYADINTVLARESEGGIWYLSEKSPDWTNARVAYGAGIELAPLDWMVAGIGYHSVRGFNVHVGYTW